MRQLSMHDTVWVFVPDADPTAVDIFRQHYSARQIERRRKFVGPGEYIALVTPDARALFVWRRELYRMDKQHGVNCAVFRNEGSRRSSDLILAAESVAWARWPGERLFTYVNAQKVKSANPGYCFKCAGWRHVGYSQRGLHLLEKLA